MNASRGKAGMDEATISGLRERVHPGLPPIGNQAHEQFRITTPTQNEKEPTGLDQELSLFGDGPAVRGYRDLVHQRVVVVLAGIFADAVGIADGKVDCAESLLRF